MAHTEYGLWYLTFQTVLDLMQSLVLSTLPFRWPWAGCLSFMMLVQAAFRRYSCQNLVELDLEARNRILNGYMLFVIEYYAIF
ncbi:hypothetical protein ACTGYN_10340, partial [Streptococcus suis]